LLAKPFTWEDSVAKFHRLVVGRADEEMCQQIKDAVRSLETIQVADLIEPLGRVKAPTRRP
jgi:2-methylcitrate dehydratase